MYPAQSDDSHQSQTDTPDFGIYAKTTIVMILMFLVFAIVFVLSSLLDVVGMVLYHQHDTGLSDDLRYLLITSSIAAFLIFFPRTSTLKLTISDNTLVLRAAYGKKIFNLESLAHVAGTMFLNGRAGRSYALYLTDNQGHIQLVDLGMYSSNDRMALLRQLLPYMNAASVSKNDMYYEVLKNYLGSGPDISPPAKD